MDRTQLKAMLYRLVPIVVVAAVAASRGSWRW